MAKTILFQGDSITDAFRVYDNANFRGNGYPTLVTAKLGFDSPSEFSFINKGISGNRVVDLYARMKCDILNIKPDYMSILIGVNDVWHEYAESPNGVSAERFEKVYSMLIEDVLATLPGLKIMILEPFTLCGFGSNENGIYPEFRREVELRAAAAKRIAEKFSLKFVPLQKKFDEACNRAEASYWLFDGVHPTAMGHELIAREWLNSFASL